MERIYAKVDDKFVTAIVLYAGASEKLFYNKDAKTEPVAKKDLQALFMQGVVIVKNGVYYRPLALKTEGLVCHDGTTATTFKAE